MNRIVGLAIALAVSGCLSGPQPGSETSTKMESADGPVTSGGEGTFWMVWVHGSETREQTSGNMDAVAMCSILFDHSLEPDAKQLQWAPDYQLDERDVRIIVAFDHFERWGDCPIAYTMHVNEVNVTQSMGRYGELALEVAPNGDIVVNGTDHVPLGERLNVTYTRPMQDGDATYEVHGQFYVENLGAWHPNAFRPE